MNLSKRERWIAIAALVALGLLAADSWLLTPLASHVRGMLATRAALRQQIAADELLLDRREAIERQWTRRRELGVALDQAAAETRLLSALQGWAADSGVSVAEMRSERLVAGDATALAQVSCRLSLGGTMRQLTDFLWRIAVAEQPVRLSELRITCQDDTRDAVAVQMTLSTVCLTDAQEGARP